MQVVIKDAEVRMQKCIEAFKVEIAKLRTGRAHPSILDHVRIEYYGNDVPIHQVASITVSDSRTLTISPWEKKLIPLIEKAILNADIGLNPVTTSDIMRVPMPALNEERRKELIKVMRHEAEGARVSVRNVRRDANATLKDALKAKQLSEDDERRLTDLVQQLTDKHTKEIDRLTTVKETELMAI
ncbi:MAG: ribosome recycling factor [Gammaproteobacteria bacterium RIFCSPHIGHO2_12_FULL_42_10]|nr:MAG: ribosome recycling factor [Gammaproteobacteria bacterium RIFCSPHIGHO2_12_FULL_42_10]